MHNTAPFKKKYSRNTLSCVYKFDIFSRLANHVLKTEVLAELARVKMKTVQRKRMRSKTGLSRFSTWP